MGKEDFIRDALRQPSDYTAYHVARELAELHPEKTILEGRNWEFDLDAFVRAEKCSVIAQKSVYQHSTVRWEDLRKKPKQRTENAWLNVLWGGELIDVVLITWADSCYRARHYWIVADSVQLAESFLDAVCEWSCDVRGEILVYQDGYFEKDKELFDAIKSATFENLILRDSLKQEIQNDFKQFLDSRETYERYGIPWRRGALFTGPPGNGKTHTVKALINALGRPCLYVRNFTGDGTEQGNMNEVFKRARQQPTVVVLEDLDSTINNANRAFFLNELDGFRVNSGVLVLATTNHPEKLDTAILDRPSRFDRKYVFALPGEPERMAYVARWNGELQSELRISEKAAAAIVKQTEGFSFAYLKELFVSSMVQWMSGSGQTSMDDVILAQTASLRGQIKTTDEKNRKEKKDKKKKK
ncbi:MAG TPA: AAA family ATPase [Pyrinomonadaceae bacterium]|nr:AAA family ATPase [Pyrinomonadaceae bacterium]